MMKKLLTLLFTSISLLLLFPGCYNDNEYDLYPFKACDSTNVTYAQTIAPIMTSNCNVCHSSSLASGGVVTDNYSNLYTIAQSGLLWGVVSHASGFKQMPNNGTKLSDCDLGKINIWIKAGSPNN